MHISSLIAIFFQKKIETTLKHNQLSVKEKGVRYNFSITRIIFFEKTEKKQRKPNKTKKKTLSLQRFTKAASKQQRACGEIGRRARLRIWCLATCRFESYQAHDETKEDNSREFSSFLFL